MKKYIILAMLAALFLAGCGKSESSERSAEKKKDEINVIKNSSTPSDPDLQVIPEILFTIRPESEEGTENFERLQHVSVAADGSFFVIDQGSYTIKKFSKEGRLLESFGGQGNGPGEFTMLNTGMAVLNDNIFVPDPATMSVQVFGLNGDFIRKINMTEKGSSMIVMPEAFSDENILALNTSVAQREGKIFLKTRLSVFDRDLDPKADLWESEEEFDPQDIARMMSMGNDYPAFTASGTKIYVSEPGVDRYQITEYDVTGKILSKIKMPYRKVRYTQDEKDQITKTTKSYVDASAKEFMDNYSFDEKFKKAVVQMYCDHKKRLWVERAYESTEGQNFRKIDVFKNGIYQNTFDLKDSAGKEIKGSIKLSGGRLFALDFENNELSVYQLTL
ncbi:MAG: 6-bladed beta-propeller [Candidatus Delongbacteria bacterium]